MIDLQRAKESINDLQLIIDGLNEEATGMNAPNHSPDFSQKTGPYGVPVAFIGNANSTISAMLDALRTADRSVYDGIGGKPPEWWRDVKTMMIDERLENSSAHSAFVDAFHILDRHASDQTEGLLSLIFLIDRLEFKIITTTAAPGFKRIGEPNSHQIDFSFNPEIDDQIDGAIAELLGKVSTLPKRCVSFLRSALNEIEIN